MLFTACTEQCIINILKTQSFQPCEILKNLNVVHKNRLSFTVGEINVHLVNNSDNGQQQQVVGSQFEERL